MRTPDEFLPKPKRPEDLCQDPGLNEAALFRCQNPGCEVRFAHRKRGPSKYCSSACRQSLTENSRQSLSRLRRYLKSLSVPLNPVANGEIGLPLNRFIESLPVSPGDQLECFLREVDALESLLIKDPTDFPMRAELRTRAIVLILAISQFQSASAEVKDYQLIATRTLELLRDIPAEGTLTEDTLRTQLSYANSAVRFFLNQQDWPNTARTLIALGNVYRVADFNREAAQKFRWAFYLLKEKCKVDRPFLASLLHEAKCWRLRIRGMDKGQAAIRMEIDALRRLAFQATDARRWVMHQRDVAGFANYLLGDKELCERELAMLALRRYELQIRTEISDPTLLTPEIGFLFTSQRRDQAIELIRKQYLPLYELYPNEYNYKRIAAWRAAYRFEIAVPPPKYTTALLSYLPRYSPQFV